MVPPHIIETLRPYFGTSPIVFIESLCIAANGGQIFKDSTINHLESLRTDAPELAGHIGEGLKYPHLEQALNDLAKELGDLKNSPQKEKTTKLQKIKGLLDSVKTVSDVTKEVKPYAKTLYSLAKPFIESHTGTTLPDWQ